MERVAKHSQSSLERVATRHARGPRRQAFAKLTVEIEEDGQAGFDASSRDQAFSIGSDLD